MFSRRSLAIIAMALVFYVVAAQGKAPPVPPKKGPVAKENIPAPMVYFAVMEDYKNDKEFTKLAYPVSSAIKMANQFVTIGYQVRFVTEGGSIKKAKDGLDKKAEVQEFNNGDEITTDIKKWLNAVAVAKPPIAILVLSGHGEERVIVTNKNEPGRKVAFLLTRPDTSGQGGISVDEISEAAAEQGGAPIVIIYDACRKPADKAITSPNSTTFATGVPSTFKVTAEFTDLMKGKIMPSLSVEGMLPQGVTFVDNANGTATLAGKPDIKDIGTYSVTITATAGQKSVSQIFTLSVRAQVATAAIGDTNIKRGAARSASGHPYPTILYSTQSGKDAKDKDCLIDKLADGLKYDVKIKDFLKSHAPAGLPISDEAMTLYHWFYYGVTRVLGLRLEQSHDITISDGAPLSTVVYRVVGGKMQPPLRTNVEIDLLRDFHQAQGKLDAPNLWSGLTVTRPVGQVADLYASSEVGKPDGCNIDGMFLEADVIATPGPKTNKAALRSMMAFGLSPEHWKAPAAGMPGRTIPLRSLGAGPIGLAFNLPTRVKFPLKTEIDPVTGKSYLLNVMAIQAYPDPVGALGPWPEDATLKFVELKLKPEGQKKLAVISANTYSQEALQKWLVDKLDSQTAFTPYDLKHPFVEVKTPGIKKVLVSGSLLQRLYATPATEFEIDIQNRGGDVTVSIYAMYKDELENTYKVAEPRTANIKRGQALPPVRLGFSDFGYINSIAIEIEGKDNEKGAHVEIRSMAIKPKKK